jgi:hypothetical protein
MNYIEQLTAIRDRYVQMLANRQGLPGMSWPESEEFLRTAIRELNAMIREGDAAASDDIDTESVSQAVT